EQGKVSSTESLGQRSLKHRRVHERDLDRERDEVDEQAASVKASKGAVRLEEVLGPIHAAPDQIEVGEIDGGPWDQEIEERRQVVLERCHEVSRTHGRDPEAHNGDEEAS